MGNNISAILLAAGLSSRMGQPKLLLPWGRTTVLERVVSTFAAAGMEEIIVVTGGAREQIEGLVAGLAKDFPVRAVYNPEYSHGEMLSSIQSGLAGLNSSICAALIGLGDQPQVREETVRRICAVYIKTRSPLVIPSFQNRRGHPWLAAFTLWPKILALPISTTPRQFLNSYAGQVEYVAADRSILQDLDTPEDYAHQRP
jgi:molybdenum cofactor cytidylyltransferase